ncbi:hypothetical protein GJ496_007540 [Pomphorhynchus laevis]|nr:hypothetical protein GJ496_007540 [Pomphorhynchus laevis]
MEKRLRRKIGFTVNLISILGDREKDLKPNKIEFLTTTFSCFKKANLSFVMLDDQKDLKPTEISALVETIF